MEKYLIIVLVLTCVFLGAYAARLQRKLSKSEDACHTAIVQKRLLQSKLNQNELLSGLVESRHGETRRLVTRLEQRLLIANTRLAIVRNRLHGK